MLTSLKYLGKTIFSASDQESSPQADDNVIEVQTYQQDIPSTPSSITTLPPQRSCEIYYKNMLAKDRGSPLWKPEPNKNLSVPSRRKGVSIGDVGILTKSGGFCSFFNICLPRDHVVNRKGVPEGFIPLTLADSSEDIQRDREFPAYSYLVSQSVKISCHEQRNSGYVAQPSSLERLFNSVFVAFFFRKPNLRFTSTAAEGAILIMPRGAHSEDIINIRRFRRYMAANLENWYRYVVGVRGCEVKNGDIRLVMGCDKTSAWDMAIFTSPTIEPEAVWLKLQPAKDTILGKAYHLEYSGMSDTRSGPTLSDIENLKAADSEGSSTSGEDIIYDNQCLFVRTLNTTLLGDVWDDLSTEIESGHFDEDFDLDNDPSTGSSQPPSSRGGSGGVQEENRGTSFNSSNAPRTHAANGTGPPLQFSYPDPAIVSHIVLGGCQFTLLTSYIRAIIPPPISATLS